MLVAVVGLIEVHSDGGSELLVGNATSLYTLDKPIGASPRMFSVELWCTGSCFGHAGMVHRGGVN